MKRTVTYITFLAALFLVCAVLVPSLTYAVTATPMTNYCASPPFIERPIAPNLLLTIDNSSSMWDLQYVDLGRKACSNAGGTYCIKDSDCPPGGTCSVAARNATYCYDETYSNASSYMGYYTTVDAATNLPLYYEYDFVKGLFSPTATFPDSQAACGTHDAVIFRENTFCLDIDSAALKLYKFVASGNFMNWLASSKFDVEKAILTGGKYGLLSDAATYGLIAETRGCVGRKFLKQPLSADFIPYNQCTYTPGTTPVDCDPNLGNKKNVIFGVRGPVDQANPTAVSLGGQTSIEIYYGQYNAANCQQAISDYSDPSVQKNDFINDIGRCISYSATNKNQCELNPAFNGGSCNSDTDCIVGGGICNVPLGACQIVPDGTCDATIGMCASVGTCQMVGTCGPLGGGACGLLAGAACSANNGTCSGSGGNKTCNGGGKAGAACNNNKDCEISQCTNAGSKTGYTCTSASQCYVCTNPGALYNSSCTTSTQCNTGTCTAGQVGASCTTNSQCNKGTCTAGKIGDVCTQDSECNAGTCTSGNVGNACTQNADCNISGHCTAGKLGDVCTQNSQCNTSTGTCTSGNVGMACMQNSDCNTAIGICGATTTACASNADCFVGPCLPPVTTQIKSTFGQSMHSCYQFKNGTDVGSNEIQQVTNNAGCAQIYASYHICNGGSKDGLQCSSDANCPSGICVGGPDAVRPGSPVLLCSSAYAGYCATTSDNWATTKNVTWVSREYADADTCVLEKYRTYCGAVQTPPVTDPTNDPSNTSTYQNLPAIINDIGVGGQLGNPVSTLTAGVATVSAPTGLIQDFASSIRLGAMSFDFNGSAAECGVRHADGTITPNTPYPPAFCSNNIATACTSDADCSGTGRCNPAVPCPYVCIGGTNDRGGCALLPGGISADCPGGTCEISTANTNNLDGSRVLPNSYIGNDIPTSPDSGHGVPGLIDDIDDLTANSWTPFSEGFYNAIGYYALTSTTLIPMRLNATDFNTTPLTSQQKCQKNNVLLITDGQSTADLNSTVTTLLSSNSALLPSGVNYDTAANNSCVPYAGSRNLESLSWIAQNRNIQNIAAQTPQTNSQKISTYVVYSGTGSLDSDTCEDETIAQLAALPDCQPDKLMCKTARYGAGKYYLAQDPDSLKASLKKAFTDIATSAASGTAASVLASGEGSGANLVQAIFYPARESGTYEVGWTGKLQNFWYFIDPRLGNSTIMEDTDLDKSLKLSADNTVGFVYDPVAHQTTVTTTSPAGVVTPNVSLDDVHYLWEAGRLLLSRPAGTANGATPGTGDRRIFTNTRSRGNCSTTTTTSCSATSDCPNDETCLVSDYALDKFDTTNAAALYPLVNITDDAGYTQTTRLIKYIRGIDDLDNNGVPSRGDPAVGTIQYLTDAGDTIAGAKVRNRTLTQGTVTDVWKLGDIVNSTPKILSWMPVNTYYEIYGDETYKTFTDAGDYKARGMVFAGANDGLLHAFKLGLLGLYKDPDLQATLGTHCSVKVSQACECTDGTYPCSSGIRPSCPVSESCVKDSDLGQEMWAFIPKNSLPYLKYTADENYCHLYFIDAQPFIFDASYAIAASAQPAADPDTPASDVCSADQYWNCKKATKCGADEACTGDNSIDLGNTSWRTVLIGSMRLGGACRNTTSSCQDCTKTPMSNVGYSSYFALDITDPVNPKLLWEFSNRNLGYSTSGPAVVRVTNPSLDKKYTNGKWLAIFGSGPTGWVSQNNNMAVTAMQSSSKVNYFGADNRPYNMRLFVVDVPTGKLVKTIDTGEQGAFTGSLLNATMDFDQDDLSKSGNYRDDAVYFGYTKPKITDAYPYLWYCADSGTANTLNIWSMGAQTAENVHKGRFIELLKFDTVNNFWTYQGAKLIISSKYNAGPATHTVKVDSNWPVMPDAINNCQTAYRISDGWTKGGVKRLLTSQETDLTKWAVSTVMNSDSLGADVGPVSASIKKLQKYSEHSVRLFFGTGRYYYRLPTSLQSDPANSMAILDDPSNRRKLYGVKEPCFSSAGVDLACTTITSGNIAGGALKVSSIGEAATAAGIDLVDPALEGWWIPLDGCRDTNLATVDCVTAGTGVANPAAVFKAERVVTDPLAATSGGVFFSTIVPTADPCEYGGRSYLWAVRYDTGGTLVNTGVLKGKAIIQRSTGDIEQIDLATAFKADHGGQAGERKTAASFGLTGSGGISIVVPPQPINRILHIQKR